MNPPDKIYVPSQSDLTCGIGDGTYCYIREDAILKWIKEQEKNLKYHTVSADAYQLALDMLKEKLNSL